MNDQLTQHFNSFLSFIALFAMLTIGFPVQAQVNATPAEQQESTNYVPGALILKVKPEYRHLCQAQSISEPGIQDLATTNGVMATKTLFPHAEIIDGQVNALGQAYVDISLIYELRFPDGSDMEALADRFSNLPAVRYAEPRYLHESFFSPDDPFLNTQWYLDTVRAEAAWDIEKGDTSIVIAFIDTGTSFTHNDLVNQVAYNIADPIDGIDNDNDGYTDNYRGWDFGGSSFWAPEDNDPSFVGTGPGQDHGVLVTGAACAEPNNSTGIAGLGYNTHFMPLKAAVDQSISISFGYDAIVYAADHGADIVNLSWGSGSYTQYGQDIINYATVNHDVLCVAASGNRHQESNVFPASFANVISVGATQVADQIWNAQNGTGTTYNFYVDMTAPGAFIHTTAGPNSYWSGSTGTSMSAPLVCAGAALVMAKNPQLTPVQAGELVRVATEDIYPVNGAYLEDRMGTGQLDLLKALTINGAKSVRIDSLMIRDDENDVTEPFDTVQVYARFLNYLDPIQNLSVSLEAIDTSMVEVLQGSSSIGAMPTLATAFNSTPFLVRVKKNVSEATGTFLKFTFSDGTYSDFQYFSLRILPTSIDMDANKVHTSVNAVGNFGFADFPANQIGLGFEYNGNNNIVQDAGFIAGLSQSKVVDNLRSDLGERKGGWSLVERGRKVYPGTVADLEVAAHFDDSEAGTHEIGLDVQQRNYQFTDAGHDQYIIMEYTVRNRNNFTLNDLYTGLSMQLSQTFYGLNSNFYQNGEMIATLASNGTSLFWSGMAMITDDSLYADIIPFSSYNYTDQEKFNALTNPTSNIVSKTGNFFTFVSGGPKTLQAGDSIRVAFVVFGGSSIQDLETVVGNARQRYWCEIRNELPTVDLGADIVVCNQDPLPILQAASPTAVQYQWSNGATTPSLTATESGVFELTVTNAYGCTATDDIEVEFRDLSELEIGLPVGTYFQGTPLDLRGLANAMVTSWNWDLGDGNSSTDQNPLHTYAQAGTFTVTLSISDGICSYSTDTMVTITPLVGIDPQELASVTAFPNPFQDQLKVAGVEHFLGEMEIRLLDGQGKIMLEERLEADGMQEYSLSVGDLPAGIYLLEVSYAGEQTIKRLVKR